MLHRPPREGDRAPDFALPAAGGVDRRVTLGDLVRDGPALLLFFPFAFSPGCGNELRDFDRRRERFAALGCSLAGISVDSPFALRAFAEHLGLGFPLLSDFNREACRRYGLLADRWGLRGFADRAVFLVSPQRRILWAWRAPDPGVLPDPDEALAAVAGAGGGPGVPPAGASEGR